MMPDAYQTVREAFATPGLITTPVQLLAGLSVPAESVAFLRDIGLPAGEPYGFNFQAVRTLRQVHFADPDDLSPLLRIGTGNLRCLADAPGAVMILDAERTWSVVILDREDAAKQWFVNTRVEFLGQCLAASALVEPQQRHARQPAAVAATLREELIATDAEAINHPLSWWSYIVEEFELGMI
jgi:hypothetical protein